MQPYHKISSAQWDLKNPKLLNSFEPISLFYFIYVCHFYWQDWWVVTKNHKKKNKKWNGEITPGEFKLSSSYKYARPHNILVHVDYRPSRVSEFLLIIFFSVTGMQDLCWLALHYEDQGNPLMVKSSVILATFYQYI